MSKERPTSIPKNRAGATPAISNRWPPTEIVSPGTRSRPPKSRRQKRSLRTAAGEAQSGVSSAGPSMRPRRAPTPTVSKNVPLTHIPSAKRASPPDARLTLSELQTASFENAFCSERMRSHIGYVSCGQRPEKVPVRPSSVGATRTL